MTVINVSCTDDEYILKMDGHTGMAQRGSDILCAALSTIEYMLTAWAERNDDIVDIIDIDEGPGHAYIRLKIKDGRFKAVSDMVGIGLMGISELYPDNVKIYKTGENLKYTGYII